VSRIGKLIIPLPKGVTVKENNSVIEVKGPKGDLSEKIPKGVSMTQKDNTVSFTISGKGKQMGMNHGLARALTANMVKGVSVGFTKTLAIIGVGYRTELKGNLLIFSLGYSHPIYFELPKIVQCKVEDRGLSIVLESIDKAVLGKVAANIRSLRPPEPYKGKGIRYKDEYVRIKEGKAKG
jgi:large subunit ribosomal protein L6